MFDSSLQWNVHLLIAAVQTGHSLYLTALPIIIKERCLNSSGDGGSPNSTAEEGWEKSISRVYTTCRILKQLVPIVPCLLLARLGDRGWRRVTMAVPLLGLVLARVVMLLMLTLDWQLEVLYVEVALAGLCGGMTAVSSGTLTLLSLSCAKQERSMQLMRAEVTSGVAGVFGSVASGYLYNVTAGSLKPGVVTMTLCLLINATCMVYVLFFLEVNQFKDLQQQNHLNSKSGSGHVTNIVLLWLAVVLYGAADTASRNILVLFEMIGPLHWDITQVGYGNASGNLAVISSFVSALVLSRGVSDITLITIGMLANSASTLLMAFVTETYMFYIARSLAIFSPMPIPIVRSLLCQQVHGSSYGVVLTSMQLSLKCSSVIYAEVYTKILDDTLMWFPGLVYIISSLLTAVAVIPVRIMASEPIRRCRCWRPSEEEDNELLLLPQDTSDTDVQK